MSPGHATLGTPGIAVPKRRTGSTEPPWKARGVGSAVPRLADPPGEERLPFQWRRSAAGKGSVEGQSELQATVGFGGRWGVRSLKLGGFWSKTRMTESHLADALGSATFNSLTRFIHNTSPFQRTFHILCWPDSTPDRYWFRGPLLAGPAAA